MAREIILLTDEEVLALDEVLIRDNESLNYVSYDGGWGKYTWADHNVYIGNWKRDRRHGCAKAFFSGGIFG